MVLAMNMVLGFQNSNCNNLKGGTSANSTYPVNVLSKKLGPATL